MLENSLPLQTVRYLNHVLGGEAVRAGADINKTAQFPFFLQDAYEVWFGELFGQPVTLACVKGDQPLAPEQIEQHTKRMGALVHTPVIIALPSLSPGERKQLIARGVAFVVPDRQLFAPQMGMILTERFGVGPRPKAISASPATQALLVWFLNHHPVKQTWHPSLDATALGYTEMTASRAVQELLQFRLFELDVRGRARHLKLIGDRRELWEKAKPYLRTPVQRTLWTYDRRIFDLMDARWAGESALARLTMLNAPQQQVIAMTADAAQGAKATNVFFEPRELADGIAVQVWRYEPRMQDITINVDPLSLWLSLRDNRDDRIQMALDELEEKFPW